MNNIRYTPIRLLYLSLLCVFSMVSINSSFSQCNTNITICEPGAVAGPFNFQTASPNPSFCLDFINGAGTNNYAYIILYITQGGDLDLLITGNNAGGGPFGFGGGCLDVALYDITNSVDPCSDLSAATEIGCNYVAPCVGCAEFGNTINDCDAQVNAPPVQTGDIIMILVEDWSDEHDNFTMQLGNGPNSAQTGPPDGTVTPVGPFCDDDPAIQLNAVNMGGTWTGPGVSPTGLFNPATAGPGTHTINYSIGSPPCLGEGSTTITVNNCDECVITAVNVSPGACNNNLFDLTGSVSFNLPPTTGQLIIEDCNGNSTALNPPFVSPMNFSIPGLPTDGTQNCTVTATFSDEPNCTLTSVPYNNPSSCDPCEITSINYNVGPCDTNDEFEITGQVIFNFPPAAGQLIITDCNGNSTTLNAPFASPANFSLSNLPADGLQNCQLTAVFSSDIDCNITSDSYDHPESCDCDVEVNAGNNISICEGEEVTLTAFNPDGALISWSDGVVDGQTFTLNTAGNYTYTVTASLPDCSVSDQVTVIVNPNPTVFAGNNVTVCGGQTVVLTATGADQYQWSHGVPNGQAFIPTETATYDVIGTTNAGCIGTDDVTVFVENAVEVSFTADVLTGCVPITTTFTNTSAQAGTECVWILGDGTVLSGCNQVSHTFTNSGCFDVTLQVTTADGCISSTTYSDYVCPVGYPIALFNPTPFEVSNLNPEIFFQNASMGATSYTWNFGDGSAGSTNTNPIHTFPNEGFGTYIVELIAVNDEGCADTTRAVIRVIEEIIFYVPNSFTPDFDQYNQVFQPIFTSGFDPYDYHLTIFNRWGETIFESYNHAIGWDGTYGATSDRIVKEGTYVWKIEFKTTNTDERQVHTGHVTLIK